MSDGVYIHDNSDSVERLEHCFVGLTIGARSALLSRFTRVIVVLDINRLLFKS